MVNQRDRILDLKQYLEQCGIEVNIGKNKARGNKGVFVAQNCPFGKLRIDISKDLDESAVISTMIHEFAHFIHYKYDKKLSSFDFLFDNITDDQIEELLKVSVYMLPKKEASEFFIKKDEISKEIHSISSEIKEKYPEFRLTKPLKTLEKSFASPINYLLKYDSVKIFNKTYSIKDLENYNLSHIQECYIRLKSKQRFLRRINSRITKINHYYNKPTELIARFIELYFVNNKTASDLAPQCTRILNEKIKYNIIPEFNALKSLSIL